MLQTINDRNHVQINMNLMKVSSGFCALPLVHLWEWQVGVLLVRREEMKLKWFLLWDPPVCVTDLLAKPQQPCCALCASRGFVGGSWL